eukprot:512278_1
MGKSKKNNKYAVHSYNHADQDNSWAHNDEELDGSPYTKYLIRKSVVGSQFLFIGSSAELNKYANNGKGIKLKKAGDDGDKTLPNVKLDFQRVGPVFTELGCKNPVAFIQSDEAPEKQYVLQVITNTFKVAQKAKQIQRVYLYYSGHGDNDGDWYFEKGRIGLRDIVQTKQNCMKYKELVLYLDCCHSGAWVEEAKERKYDLIKIYAACGSGKSAYDGQMSRWLAFKAIITNSLSTFRKRLLCGVHLLMVRSVLIVCGLRLN